MNFSTQLVANRSDLLEPCHLVTRCDYGGGQVRRYAGWCGWSIAADEARKLAMIPVLEAVKRQTGHDFF